MKMITIEVTVPEGLKAGDTFKAEVALPVAEKKPRGQLAGINLEEMTDEQLKREIINSSSVLYKATQRGAAAETIAANQARVDAAKAEKVRRTPVVAQATAVSGLMDQAAPAGDAEAAPADSETASEI